MTAICTNLSEWEEIHVEEYLLRHGLTAEQTDGLGKGFRAFEEVLERGWLDERSYQAAVAEYLGIPLLEEISVKDVSMHFVESIPISFARQNHVIGLKERDGTMPVALGSISNSSALGHVSTLLDRPVRPVLAPPSVIESANNRAYGSQASGVESMIASLDVTEAEAELNLSDKDGDLLDNLARAPVIKLVNMILFDAVKRRASDVHLQPYPDRIQVRFRVDGVLYDCVKPPKALQDEIISRIKVIGRMNIAEKRLPQDGRTTVTVGDRMVDLRISVMPTSHGERVVLRLLDKSARLYELPELGMVDRDLGTFRRLIQRPHGIILVTGPTGSGKSTTLYAALQYLNSDELNIITVEDPIEYQLPGISQTQVSDKKGMTFAAALRTILRQDPDVIMIGEIRDEETARMAVQSSLTGHLVFSTLHTNDASSAVARLLDLGVEPFLVASSLLAVIAQRLVRQICPECKSTVSLTDEEKGRLGLLNVPQRENRVEAKPNSCRPFGLGSTDYVAKGCGCESCFRTGYFERLGIFELLEVNEAVRRLIVSRAETAAIKRAAMTSGMTTLREDALRKLFGGRTTIEDVFRVTHVDEFSEASEPVS